MEFKTCKLDEDILDESVAFGVVTLYMPTFVIIRE